MAKKIDIPKDNNIIKIPIEEAMPDNYLPYAVEVAKDRALPDVRDGLKPVHRRILYGSYMLKAFPDKPYYKSARIVGDILGKYHPHGDTSVYDAMVILAQDFTTRMPLIDGHGNWGSQDGDSAAAMRYTEARLTKLAMELIKDLDKGVVDMVDNYSASELEPKVLPAKYPNLLVNGAFGIAVGLATNIPPHNLGEVINATLAYIDNNEITTKELLNYIKGPDLPTGGILIGKNALLSAYETGEGKVTLRSKTSIEKLENGRLGIVITEFPYRRSKARLLQTISEMTDDKRHAKALEAIVDIRDESDRTGIRAVIELKKAADEKLADKILKYLFKKTELQCNVSFNMVALADGKPETLGLKAILVHYVNHQKDVITRRTKKELEIAERRFHIVEGFIKAIDIIDEIIAVIRASKSKKDSEANLMDKFGFTQLQAEAIVELMLYRLTGLEIKAFEKEHKELEKEIKRLKKILENEKELLKVIKGELLEIKDKYGDTRRTLIIEDDEEAKIDLEELIIVEDTMITVSNEGYIKRIPLKSYNRSSTDVTDIEYREGDFNRFLFQSNTKDTVLIFTNKGNMYQLKGVNIPEFKWRDKGVKIDEVIRGLDLVEERIVNIFSISSFVDQKDFILFTSRGVIKKSSLDKFATSYSKLSALKLKGNEELISVELVDNAREEAFINIKTKLGLEFSLEEPKLETADRNIIGVQLFSLSTKDEVSKIEYVDEYEYKNFFVDISSEGMIRTRNDNKGISKKYIRVSTNVSEKLLIFTNTGNVFSLPSFIISNLKQDEISLEALIDGFDKGMKVLNTLSIREITEDQDIYFFSRRGLVKKTSLSEFKGDYSYTLGYKLKNEADSLIAVAFSKAKDEREVIMITRRAMCIRFDSNSINYMGKVASGVTGISLKEDDEVVYAAVISKENSENNKDIEIVLSTNQKDKHKTTLSDIKLQNRAGRGSNIMILVMNDYIIEVNIASIKNIL